MVCVNSMMHLCGNKRSGSTRSLIRCKLASKTNWGNQDGGLAVRNNWTHVVATMILMMMMVLMVTMGLHCTGYDDDVFYSLGRLESVLCPVNKFGASQ